MPPLTTSMLQMTVFVRWFLMRCQLGPCYPIIKELIILRV
jgi:hypothetical protein